MSDMEPKIICPKCKTEIKLTESLAAPLIESTKRVTQAGLFTQATAGVYGIRGVRRA